MPWFPDFVSAVELSRSQTRAASQADPVGQCVRWGDRDLPPQADLGVWERGPNGRLAAVRVYDDVEPPAGA